MKHILSIIIIMFCATGQLLAQYEGKQFLAGSAAIGFGNTSPKGEKASNGYGYNFDISLGKFKTDKKAVGWRISNSLTGGTARYNLYNGTGYNEIDKSGINNVGFGIGRFWQYYKHFNNKMGLFAGPDINLGYSYGKSIIDNSSNGYLNENSINKIQLALGVSAGLYYQLSEKWWVNASLAFSNPVSVDYSFISSVRTTMDVKEDPQKSGQLNYSFTPSFTFPSVGFGLRYFYNR